ncbi:T9SS type B sorting domain-containing protein [Flavobacterium psychrotolerans]|uniref:Adhesin n=1 Tax=Flavobacterium psychrotolerans TaxID=2169410 RepID=A0A2U1JFZ7_9FLAO|nr:T9SS type B sorting domain-containing protein [Flavobacterium psychrotolerans]PWA04066.1 hypothetical protein DB895_12815 [Flavobacterium psychrotolerans]
MKHDWLYLFFIFTVTGFSQVITVDSTKYSIPQLVSQVLINSPCIQTTNIKWSTGTHFGSSNGIGYFETTNIDFPIKRGVILSTGNIKDAPGPNVSQQNNGNSSWSGDADLEKTMAATGIPMVSTNATVLEFDFMPISSTFNFDFLFASEEYGNSQCNYSDAFAYLLTNTATGVTTNLAVVPSTNIPISVFTVRDFAYNSTCTSSNSDYFDNYYGGALADDAATNFEGNTRKMTAMAVLTPNVLYHIKLVIADRDNSGADSAIFLSSQSFNLSQDVLGLDYSIENKRAICVGSSPPDLTTGLDPAVYHFIWKKNNVVLPNKTGPTLSGITAGTYSVTYTNYINICQPITDTILIEFYPVVKASNPINLYRCDAGRPNYDYNLAINDPVVLTGSGSPLIPLEIAYYASLADANSGSNPLPRLYNSPSGVTLYVRIKNQINLCFTVKSFKLLTSPGPVANQPTDMIQCSTSKAKTSNFILASKTAEILNGQSPVFNIVTYYATQDDANSETDPLPTDGYLSTGTTLYARIQNRDEPTCFNTIPFNLVVVPVPLLDVLKPVYVCKSYTLPPLTIGNYYDEHVGTGNQYFANDVITETTTHSGSNVTILYIYNPTTLCSPAPENSFKITFVNLPLITPKSGTYCSNDGFTLPALEYGKYFTAPNGSGSEIKAGTIITTTQTIYTYFQSVIDPTCTSAGSFRVSIIDAPQLFPYPNVYDCSSYTLPPIAVGHYFDQPNGLGNKILPGTVITETKTIYAFAETGTTPNCTDSKEFTVYIGSFPHPTDSINCVDFTLPVLPVGNYFTGAGGTGTEIVAGTVINTTTALYIYVPANVTSNCPTFETLFTITVNLPPLINPNDNSVAYCNSYTLLPLTHGNYYTGKKGTGILLHAGYEVRTSQTIYIYISLKECDNELPFSMIIHQLANVDNRADLDFCGGVSYILTPMSAGSVGNYYTGRGGTGKKLRAGDAITTTQTIYVYGNTDTTPACPVENYFTITFTPRVDVSNPIDACESYTLPVLTAGNYFTESGGKGTLLHAGDKIDTNQKIYIYNEFYNRNGICTDESNFTITITRPVIIDPIPTAHAFCDTDGINDGIVLINSTTLSAEIIAGQASTNYNVTYYATENDANLGIKPLTTIKTQDAYIKINNLLTPNCFSKAGKITVTVNKIPDPTPNGGILCANKHNSILIQSGVSLNNHIFEWYNTNATALMPSETENSLSVTLPDTYGVMATNTLTHCSSQIIAVEVLKSSPPATLTFEATDAFEDNQTVTVVASGDGGDYEYQLDFGPFQDSSVFENIASGEHKITVNDKNGCGTLAKKISVFNYPKFFTPNADGFNDYWMIKGMQNLPKSLISIYDRYGKILKQMKPSDYGWDGLYKNSPMPSEDYWFKIVYEENGVMKEFDSHFALKR